jgi:hypothetical protein
MAAWVVIDSNVHKCMGWRQRQAFEFASTQQTADVLLPELSSLLPHYTLCFMQQNDGYKLVALLGLGGERNLYVNQENYWTCHYVPASLRSYPFTLATNSETGEKVFCIEESHITDDSDATAFFDNDDNLANETATVFGFLSQCENSRETTQRACNALAEAGVIGPWKSEIKRGQDDEEPVEIKGLHCINETAMNEVSKTVLEQLRDVGALPIAYAQLFSMNQFPQLGQRADHFAKQQEEAAGSLGLSGMFEEEGSLNFDSI